MTRIKPLLITCVVALLLITVTAVIKFNFIDVPYVGEPTVYFANSGEQAKVFAKADDSIRVHVSNSDNLALDFVAYPVRSASGAQYKSKDGAYIFWSKGSEASIYDHDWQRLFQGSSQTSKAQESIYFVQSKGQWLDSVGVCHSCTPEHGFAADGSVDQVIWQEVTVKLLNDLGEAPDTSEVKELFEQQYAEPSGYYPAHVTNDNGTFTIIVAVPIELKDIDFFDRTGALYATYEIVQ